ncbi:MAG: hypothetical protein EXS48_03165 [Candidatus Staskawiczbacteria bacterium]|nr:hypothetical protein [Candidatus Staskawiczbacteria bacterium]
MTTKSLQQKTNKLERELELLRSFVIGQFGGDPEGEYNPKFVKEILKAAKEKPKYEFKDGKSFLKQIRGK